MILLTRLYDELVIRVNTTYPDKENLEKKIENVDIKISNTSKFIVTQNFNSLTKMNFNARMAEASKNLRTKKPVEKSLYLGNKDRQKKNSTFALNYFTGKNCFDNDGLQN